MIEKRTNEHGDFRLYASVDIPAQTLLFSYDEWIEDEKFGWQTLTVEEKKAKLARIIRVLDIAIGVLDRKIRLKGISQEFIYEARDIKKKYTDEKGWFDYLNILSWFK